MKKFLVLGLIAMLGAGLAVGCSSDDSPNNNNGNENPNGNDNVNNQTVSIVGYWIGNNEWEFDVREYDGLFSFSTAKKPNDVLSLGVDELKINSDNTEIELYSVNTLRFILQCTLTATTLTITSAEYKDSAVGVGVNKNFPIGVYTKRQ